MNCFSLFQYEIEKTSSSVDISIGGMFTEPFCGYMNRIGGVIVSVLASSAVDRGFEPRSGQTKDFTIGICSFSA